ncbi:MAG: hypothetical protein KC933_24505 [Myxococcales bacterium]|nr:hypothetical protein [Myxococcales bacterium]MCB9647309.1 hypothetical protein [Deltaproteobacteria bacterium]
MNEHHRSPPHLILPLLLPAALALAGCVASPADGTQVSSTSQTLNFSGFHPNASAPVRVMAYNFSARRYDEVSSGVSTSTRIPASYWDDPLYEWWAPSRSLGSAYWEPGRCTGARALIKGETTVGGRVYGMYSWDLEKNAEGCTNEHRNNADWVTYCSASQSELTTTDYSNDAHAFDISFNAAFSPDATCTSVTFSYNHATGAWTDVRATYQQGGTSRSMSCSETSSSRGRTYGTCRLNLGTLSAMRSFIEWHQTNQGTVAVSARDARCRTSLRASRNYTVASSRYDYGWTRWTTVFPQCVAPPPPPPPSDPHLHEIQCDCVDVSGVAATIRLSGCLETSSSPVTGASLMCGYAALALEANGGIDTACAFRSLSAAGASCTNPGWWAFAP